MLWGIVRVPCGLTRLQGNAEQGLQLGSTELFPLLGAMTPKKPSAWRCSQLRAPRAPRGQGGGRKC